MWKFQMKFDRPGTPAAGGWRSVFCALLWAGVLAGCALPPPLVRSDRYDAPGPLPVLAYYQMLGRLSAADLAKERTALAALAASPNTHLRQAMVIGHPRGAQETAKALALVDGLLKSNEPAAIELQPVARMLADHYNERLRLEGQFERQGTQLKETQRKAQELQEKLDGLADIERTLTPPPRSGRGGKP